MSVRPKRVRDSDTKGRPVVEKPPLRLPPKKRRRKSKKQENKTTDEDPPEEKMDRFG